MEKSNDTEIEILTEKLDVIAEEFLENDLIDSILLAMENYYDSEIDTIICLTVDLENNSWVFSYGSGKDVKSANDKAVFSTIKSENLKDYHKIVKMIKEKDNKYDVSYSINDLIGDAIAECDYIFDGIEIELYGSINYKTPSWWYEPFYSSEHDG